MDSRGEGGRLSLSLDVVRILAECAKKVRATRTNVVPVGWQKRILNALLWCILKRGMHCAIASGRRSCCISGDAAAICAQNWGRKKLHLSYVMLSDGAIDEVAQLRFANGTHFSSG